MNVLAKSDYSCTWFNQKKYNEIGGHKVEIYCDDELGVDGFVWLFHLLFGEYVENLRVRTMGISGIWGNFCLDTWNIHDDVYDYSEEGKSEETATFLKLLADSNIEASYNGYCVCNDWDSFLKSMMACVLCHVAPYSVLMHDISNDYLFYLHYSDSLGIYYKERNEAIDNIIAIAEKNGLTCYYK